MANNSFIVESGSLVDSRSREPSTRHRRCRRENFRSLFTLPGVQRPPRDRGSRMQIDISFPSAGEQESRLGDKVIFSREILHGDTRIRRVVRFSFVLSFLSLSRLHIVNRDRKQTAPQCTFLRSRLFSRMIPSAACHRQSHGDGLCRSMDLEIDLIPNGIRTNSIW